MKKIIRIASLFLAFTGFCLAHTAPAKKTTLAKTAAAPWPTKKDGTADMRYKANKDVAKATPVHVKKDGTADKRFKENNAMKAS